MNYILRDIKLSKITGNPPTGNAAELVKFWDELWSDMIVLIDTKKGKIECWKNDYTYYYFVQDDMDSNLICSYLKVWTFFEDNLGLRYNEIQKLIQHMVDETINNMANIPLWHIKPTYNGKGGTMNYKVNTAYFTGPYRVR